MNIDRRTNPLRLNNILSAIASAVGLGFAGYGEVAWTFAPLAV